MRRLAFRTFIKARSYGTYASSILTIAVRSTSINERPRRIVETDDDSEEAVRNLIDHWHDGCVKLYLIRKAIRFRRDHADLFRDGDFVPLQSAGPYARNVTAFVRRPGNGCALTAVPRWLSQIPQQVPEQIPKQEPAKTKGTFDWGDTRIILPSHSPAEWNDILTHSQFTSKNESGQQHFMVNDLFQGFPVAFFDGQGN